MSPVLRVFCSKFRSDCMTRQGIECCQILTREDHRSGTAGRQPPDNRQTPLQNLPLSSPILPSNSDSHKRQIIKQHLQNVKHLNHPIHRNKGRLQASPTYHPRITVIFHHDPDHLHHRIISFRDLTD